MTNEFILEYSSYVYGIAKNFEGYKNKEDLIQAGFLGLIKAKLLYKEDANTKFTTYAFTSILGEMCKLVREDKGIKLSRDLVKLKNAIEKAKNYLSQKYLRQPTSEEIAEFLELPVSRINQALKTVNMLQSIDEPICEDGKEMNFYDIIPSKQLDVETLVSLKEALNSLDENSKQILMYSIEQGMSQQEIANIANINQVQVSRTLTKIKTNLKDKIVA